MLTTANPLFHFLRAGALLFVLSIAVTTLSLTFELLTNNLAMVHAQDRVAQLEDAYRAAMNHYDTLELTEAERGLEDAIAQAQRFGIADPVVAKLHMMLGIVRYAVTRDEDAAFAQFVQGLSIDRYAVIEDDYQTPSLAAIYDRALATLPPETTEPEVIGPSATPRLNHDPVQTANIGRAIRLEVDVPADVPLYRVVLNYRRYGEREYKTIEMKPVSKTTFAATIPSDEVRSSQIDYFIEVLNRTGEILVAASSPTSPLNIMVFGDEDPVLDNDEEEDDDAPRQYFFLQGGVGTGVGFATASPVYHPEIQISPGLAISPFHVNMELGVMITPELHLSGFYRLQIKERADLGGGRLKWWFDNEGPWRLYTGVGGGFGRVRHNVNLGNATCEIEGSGCNFIDTTLEGPIHAAVLFGVAHALSDNLAIVFDINTMYLFPDISAHLDANFNIRASF